MIARISQSFLELEKEHTSVLEQCSLLAAAMKRMNQAGKVDLRLADELRKYIKSLSIVLTAHQSSEEQLLLPIIGKSLDEEATALIRREHQQISQYLSDLRNRIEDIGNTEDTKSFEAASNSLAAFDLLVRAHFSREENVLFWFASL